MNSVFQTCSSAHVLQTHCHQLLCEWIKALKGQRYLKKYPPSNYHLNSAYSYWVWRVEGGVWGCRTSNCVNSSGNCVWPLTVSIIASLLQYFAWQSERLTPEGCRPEALRLTGRGLLKAPLVSPPGPRQLRAAADPLQGRDEGRVGGCSA